MHDSARRPEADETLTIEPRLRVAMLARASRHRPSTLHRMALEVLRHVLMRVLAPA